MAVTRQGGVYEVEGRWVDAEGRPAEAPERAERTEHDRAQQAAADAAPALVPPQQQITETPAVRRPRG